MENRSSPKGQDSYNCLRIGYKVSCDFGSMLQTHIEEKRTRVRQTFSRLLKPHLGALREAYKDE